MRYCIEFTTTHKHTLLSVFVFNPDWQHLRKWWGFSSVFVIFCFVFVFWVWDSPGGLFQGRSQLILVRVQAWCLFYSSEIRSLWIPRLQSEGESLSPNCGEKHRRRKCREAYFIFILQWWLCDLWLRLVALWGEVRAGASEPVSSLEMTQLLFLSAEHRQPLVCFCPFPKNAEDKSKHPFWQEAKSRTFLQGAVNTWLIFILFFFFRSIYG